MDDTPLRPDEQEQSEQLAKSQPPTLPYVTTHCMTCKAGWTRLDADGRAVVVCLLNREPVWPLIAFCDRYQDQIEDEE